MTHVASTGAIKLFIGGNLDGSATKSGTPSSATYPLIIGQSYNKAITGSLDDLRITKGYARYTANFTPPTTEFPDS